MAYPNHSLKTDAPLGTAISNTLDTIIKDDVINAVQERLAQNHVFAVSTTGGSENTVDFKDTGLHSHITLARLWNSDTDTSPDEKLYYSGTSSDRTYASDPTHEYVDKTGTTKSGGVVFIKKVGYDTDDNSIDDLFRNELHFKNAGGTKQITYRDRLNVKVDDSYIEYNGSDQLTLKIPDWDSEHPSTGYDSADRKFLPYVFSGTYSGSDTDQTIDICPYGYEIVSLEILNIGNNAQSYFVYQNSGSYFTKEFDGTLHQASTVASNSLASGKYISVKTDLRSVLLRGNISAVCDSGQTYYFQAICKKV